MPHGGSCRVRGTARPGPAAAAAPRRPAAAPSGPTQPRSWSSVRAPAHDRRRLARGARPARRMRPGRRAATAATARSTGPSTASAAIGVHRARGARCVRRPPRTPVHQPQVDEQLVEAHQRTRGRLAQQRQTAAVAGSAAGRAPRTRRRPCSRACRAVMSAPLPMGASMTSVARLSPLMMRLRRGKVPRVGRRVGRMLAHDGTTAVADGAPRARHAPAGPGGPGRRR